LFEELLSDDISLLATDKSTEGKPSERNPIPGQSFPSTL